MRVETAAWLLEDLADQHVVIAQLGGTSYPECTAVQGYSVADPQI